MRPLFSFSVFALGLMTAASVAVGGGYVAPASDPVPVAPVADAAPEGDWAGGYVGGSIGHAFGGNDDVGVDIYEGEVLTGRTAGLTDLDVKGLNAGVHAGYRWQRAKWVFGPELTIEGGNIGDDRSGSGLVDGDFVTLGFESEVNHIVGLQVKTGYIVNPRTQIYGSAGYVRGDFDYTLAATVNGEGGSITDSYSADGYSLGLGVERRLRDSVSVFAEWQYRNFGTTEVVFAEGSDAIVTRATPEHHNIKVGLNFSF